MSKENPDTEANATTAEKPTLDRRGFLKTAAVAGTAAIAGAPFISNAATAAGQKWKVQTAWDAGTTGFTLFEEWANSIKEKSGGELEITRSRPRPLRPTTTPCLMPCAMVCCKA